MPGFLDQKVQCTVLLGQKIQCTVLPGQKKGYTLTNIVILGPTKKTGYPLSTDNIAKCYLFVTDYIVLPVQG